MEKIQRGLKNLSMFEFDISISYGIVSYCKECEIEDVLKEADQLMYKMKNQN